MRHPLLLSCALAFVFAGCPAETKPDAVLETANQMAQTPTVPVVQGDLPAISHRLSAQHTIGFLAIERLDDIVQQAFSDTGKQPPAAVAAVTQQRMAIIERLGFDPAKTDGWRTTGIDPEVGFGFTFDARISGPILFARMTDRAAAAATLTRLLNLHIEMGIEADGITSLRVDNEPMLMGERDGITYVLVGLNAESQRAAFADVLRRPTPPLADSAAFTRTFADGVRRLWISGYADTAALMPDGRADDPSVQFYVKRFERVGLAINARQTSLRFLTSQAALDAIGQIMRPAGSVPDFASHMRKDGGARFDLNLDTLFDGARDLFPAEATARSVIATTRDTLATTIGVSHAQLAAALSGHFAMSGDLESLEAPMLLAGIRDMQQVDAMLPGIGRHLRALGLSVSLDVIDGHDTYLIELPEHDLRKPDGTPFLKTKTLAVARDANLLYFGPPPDVEAALAQTQTRLPVRVAETVNQTSPMSMVTHADEYLRSQPKLAPLKGAQGLWRERMVDGYLVSGLVLDARGVRINGEMLVTFVGGLMAAIAVPAFMKFTRRTKTLEATKGVESLDSESLHYADAAHRRRNRTRFPASAPRTPPTPACKDGKRLRHLPEAKTWNHPTWRALNFSVREPFLYQYEYVSDGRSFTARAIGDLDCDGVSSTFETVGRIDADGKARSRGAVVGAQPYE